MPLLICVHIKLNTAKGIRFLESSLYLHTFNVMPCLHCECIQIKYRAAMCWFGCDLLTNGFDILNIYANRKLARKPKKFMDIRQTTSPMAYESERERENHRILHKLTCYTLFIARQRLWDTMCVQSFNVDLVNEVYHALVFHPLSHKYLAIVQTKSANYFFHESIFNARTYTRTKPVNCVSHTLVKIFSKLNRCIHDARRV